MSRSSKREQPRREPPAGSAAAPPPQDKLTAFLERRSLVLVLALILLASVRIVATYTVFNHVVDESGHIAAGMEWLEKGVYQWEAQHPPLARVASALGPYFLGIRGQGTPHQGLESMWHEGTRILYYGHNYDHTLAMARLGMLPFFWIACLAVYWWAALHFSRAAAVVAVFLFSFLPTVLAHAGITTTDMALTAFLGAAFVAGLAWVERQRGSCPWRTSPSWWPLLLRPSVTPSESRRLLRRHWACCCLRRPGRPRCQGPGGQEQQRKHDRDHGHARGDPHGVVHARDECRLDRVEQLR